MSLMAKKRPTADGAKRPQPNRTGTALHVWVDPALRHAMDELVSRTRRSLTVEISMALEAHLAQAGLWPPPAEQAGK
jgi:hypothetical protein